MMTSLCLSDFRAFESLAIEDLGQVNLFVGKNGCGKTSVLEGAAVLATGGSLAMILSIVANRGEFVTQPKDYFARREYGIGYLIHDREEYDVSHLFRGHRLEQGAFFEVTGSNNGPASVRCEVVPSSAIESRQMELLENNLDLGTTLGISLKTTVGPEMFIPLSSLNGISRETLRGLRAKDRRESKPVLFVPTRGLDISDRGYLWNEVALTPEENHVVEALRIIDPDVERIAFLTPESYRGPSSSGICVKLKSVGDRLPLGSLGGGVERLLGLSLSVVRSAEAFVMIDEIDTGLHFSVMSKMWEMVIKTACRLNVQVFATTHSQDCVRGLAELQQRSPDLCESVRLHRIEKDIGKVISYSASEILTAEEHHVEVR